MREFSLRIAGFSYRVVTCCEGLEFALGPSHARFLLPSAHPVDLLLEAVVQERPPLSTANLVFESPTGYAVGLGPTGNLLLRGRSGPFSPLAAEVDPSFLAGRLYIPADRVQHGLPFYPLETIDLLLAIHRFARRGELIAHAAGVAHGGRGYLFAGPAGVGKSTMAELWARCGQATILGEDTVVVDWQEGRAWLHGTPWHENPERCSPMGVPLAAVFLPEHGTEDGATRCGRAEGAAMLLGNCLLPLYDRGAMETLLAGVDRLTAGVPVYRLAFRPGCEAIDYVQRLVTR